MIAYIFDWKAQSLIWLFAARQISLFRSRWPLRGHLVCIPWRPLLMRMGNSKNVLLRNTKKSFSEYLLDKYLTLEADFVHSVDKVKLKFTSSAFIFCLAASFSWVDACKCLFRSSLLEFSAASSLSRALSSPFCLSWDCFKSSSSLQIRFDSSSFSRFAFLAADSAPCALLSDWILK